MDFCYANIPSGNPAMYVVGRVARWFVLKPKISNLGKFWRPFEW
jgi:hypothetical protein